MTQKQKRSRKEIERIVERYRKSGLSQKKFAAENGILYSTLQYWLKILRNEEREKSNSAVQFVQVVEQRAPAPADTSVVMEIGQKATIRFGALPEPSYWAELDRLLNR